LGLDIHGARMLALPPLATAGAMLLLGLFVLWRERASREGALFAVLAITVTVWLGCFSAMYLSSDEAVALFWARAAYLGITFIAPAAFSFAVAVTRDWPGQRRRVAASWLISALLCAASVGTGALVRDLYRYPWGYYPRFRWLGVPFLAVFFAQLALALRQYWADHRRAKSAVHRQRTRWLLVSFAIAYLGCVDYVPAYGVRLYPFGYIPIFVFIVLSAWTIRHFRLVDFTPELAAREILATVADPLIVCDREGRIRLLNQAASSVLGHRPAEMMGRAVEDLATAADHARLAELVSRGGAHEESIALRARDGEPVPVELAVSPLRDRGGAVVGRVLVARDARPHLRAQAALAASEARYRDLFEANPMPMWVYDTETLQLLAVNGTAARDYGYPRDEFLAMTIRDILMPAEPTRRDESLGSAKESSARPASWRLRTRDGRTLEVEITSHALDFGGRPARLVLAADVTARNRAEQEVRASEERFRQSEQTFRTLTESAPAAIFICEAGRFVYMNHAAELMTGYPAAALRSIPAWEIAEPTSRDLLRALLSPDYGELVPARREVCLDTRHGDERWVDLTVAPLPGRGAGASMITAYDITESKLTHDMARASERRLRDMLENVKLAALTLDTEGVVTYCNEYLLELLGCDMEELAGSRWFSLWVPADQRDTLQSAFSSNLAAGMTAPHDEYPIVTRHGDSRLISWSHTVLRGLHGEITGTASIGADVTERKRAEQRLVHEALHDALTGLPNRSLFMDRLGTALARARRRNDYRLAVLFMDLDRFKVVNDSLGHFQGDNLLIQLSRRLERCLRPADTIARLGGDEFTFLLEELAEAGDAERLALRFKGELALPFDLAGHEVYLTASIGIALGAARYLHPEDLLRDADTALHRAKAQSKGAHQVFDTPMHEHAVAALQLENDLRRALDRNEFVLHYQPIVALAGFRLAGFEALVRWQHPHQGLLPPDSFIKVAEETGLILPLGDWVMREALRQLKQWQRGTPRAHELAMTVNLSSRQFGQPDLVARIGGALREAGVAPDRLKVEITESLIVQSPATAADMLHALKGLGCSVCLDDFGTGYSSLSYLLRLPIDTLKVDRSFLADLSRGSRNSQIVWAVIELAKRLGIDVIAEGVETESQRAQLVELGCVLGQGFLFSRPLAAHGAGALLAAGQVPPPPPPAPLTHRPSVGSGPSDEAGAQGAS
jgi:diguanylate cyclase (GGDEF)-like protein/PAS domain S-box-containing protein